MGSSKERSEVNPGGGGHSRQRRENEEELKWLQQQTM